MGDGKPAAVLADTNATDDGGTLRTASLSKSGGRTRGPITLLREWFGGGGDG